MQAAWLTGLESVRRENKWWLLIAQSLQKESLPWGCLPHAPKGLLLSWLPGTVLACASPPFCPPSSLTLISLFTTFMGNYTTNYLKTLCSHSRYSPRTIMHNSYIFLSSFFPLSSPSHHHRPVPCASYLYGHDSEASTGAEHLTRLRGHVVRNKSVRGKGMGPQKM